VPPESAKIYVQHEKKIPGTWECGIGIVGIEVDCTVIYPPEWHCKLVAQFVPAYWQAERVPERQNGGRRKKEQKNMVPADVFPERNASDAQGYYNVNNGYCRDCEHRIFHSLVRKEPHQPGGIGENNQEIHAYDEGSRGGKKGVSDANAGFFLEYRPDDVGVKQDDNDCQNRSHSPPPVAISHSFIYPAIKILYFICKILQVKISIHFLTQSRKVTKSVYNHY